MLRVTVGYTRYCLAAFYGICQEMEEGGGVWLLRYFFYGRCMLWRWHYANMLLMAGARWLGVGRLDDGVLFDYSTTTGRFRLWCGFGFVQCGAVRCDAIRCGAIVVFSCSYEYSVQCL